MGQSNKKSTAELLRAASNTFIRLCDAAGRTDPAWQQREAQPHRKEATRGYVAKTKTSSQRHICVTFSQDSREEDHRRHPQPTGPLSTQQHGHNAEFWLKLLPPCFRLTMLKKAGGAVGWPKHQVWSKKKIRWEKHVDVTAPFRRSKITLVILMSRLRTDFGFWWCDHSEHQALWKCERHRVLRWCATAGRWKYGSTWL